MHHCTRTQVYAPNEELRTQLEERKRNESLLQEQISKAEQLSILQDYYEKLSSDEYMETQLNIMEIKLHDVKSKFGSIDEIKMIWTEEVANDG